MKSRGHLTIATPKFAVTAVPRLLHTTYHDASQGYTVVLYAPGFLGGAIPKIWILPALMSVQARNGAFLKMRHEMRRHKRWPTTRRVLRRRPLTPTKELDTFKMQINMFDQRLL
jgi:hypothetical protein